MLLFSVNFQIDDFTKFHEIIFDSFDFHRMDRIPELRLPTGQMSVNTLGYVFRLLYELSGNLKVVIYGKYKKNLNKITKI